MSVYITLSALFSFFSSYSTGTALTSLQTRWVPLQSGAHLSIFLAAGRALDSHLNGRWNQNAWPRRTTVENNTYKQRKKLSLSLVSKRLLSSQINILHYHAHIIATITLTSLLLWVPLQSGAHPSAGAATFCYWHYAANLVGPPHATHGTRGWGKHVWQTGTPIEAGAHLWCCYHCCRCRPSFLWRYLQLRARLAACTQCVLRHP